MRGDVFHGDAAAVGAGEHDAGDAVVAEASPGIAAPLELRLRDDGPLRAQERTVQVPQHGLLLAVAVHVHAVRGVRFAGEQAVDDERLFLFEQLTKETTCTCFICQVNNNNDNRNWFFSKVFTRPVRKKLRKQNPPGRIVLMFHINSFTVSVLLVHFSDVHVSKLTDISIPLILQQSPC